MMYSAKDPEVYKKTDLFLQKIKKCTAAQHVLLESNDLLSALMKPEVSVHQYYCYLILMKKIAEVYENSIVKYLQVRLPGFNHNMSSCLITDDLATINYVTTKSLVTEDFHLPEDTFTTAYALGFMYVMEGSKLGGKVIYKHIHRFLGFSEEGGAKYIADFGSDTIKCWKEFLLKFSGYITDNGYEEEAVSGARDAFASLFKYFESNHGLYAF